MSYLAQKNIDFGTITPKNKKYFRFVFPEGFPGVQSIDVGCKKCVSYKYYPEQRELQVTYQAGDFPKHLSKAVKTVPIYKTVTIVYNDLSIDVITLSGTKSRKK